MNYLDILQTVLIFLGVFFYVREVGVFTNSRRNYFRQLSKGVDKMIWDMEFKYFKTREIRESVRLQYDDAKMKLNLAKTKIENEEKNPTMEKGDVERIKDETVRLQRDLERYESQLKTMDLDINGAAPSSDYPDGVVGLSQQLDSLQELKVMVKEYKKTI